MHCLAQHQTWSAIETPLAAPTAPVNEVVMNPLRYGETYQGKAANIHVLPKDIEGLLLEIIPKERADWAIIEVFSREVAHVNGREMTLFRVKTQTVRVSGGKGPWPADPINMKLEDVEKINVRLVSESSVVEFWSDLSVVKSEQRRK